MGWASGSRLMNKIIGALKKAEVTEETRAEVYKAIIPAFENEDCDTLDECSDSDRVFKKVLRELNLEMYEDEEG